MRNFLLISTGLCQFSLKLVIEPLNFLRHECNFLLILWYLPIPFFEFPAIVLIFPFENVNFIDFVFILSKSEFELVILGYLLT